MGFLSKISNILRKKKRLKLNETECCDHLEVLEGQYDKMKASTEELHMRDEEKEEEEKEEEKEEGLKQGKEEGQKQGEKEEQKAGQKFSNKSWCGASVVKKRSQCDWSWRDGGLYGRGSNGKGWMRGNWPPR